MRGRAWLLKYDYDRAIKDLDEAIRLDPTYAYLFECRGSCWGAKKDFNKAIQDYTEAIRLNPNNPFAFENRGFSWLAKGEYDNAIRDFDEAIRLDPNYALAYSCRGSAWQNKKNYGKAQKDFDEASRIDPKGFPQIGAVANLGESEEAKLVEQIKKKLVLGITLREVSAIAGVGKCDKLEVYLTGDPIPDFNYVENIAPLAFVGRHFQFEGVRGQGRTGILFRLNMLFVNGRLRDWYVLGN